MIECWNDTIAKYRKLFVVSRCDSERWCEKRSKEKRRDKVWWSFLSQRYPVVPVKSWRALPA